MALSKWNQRHSLVCSSDRVAHLREFIGANFQPEHLYDDASNRPSYDLDLYVAGPPCARFSFLGLKKGEPDPTTSTLEASLTYIVEHRPRVLALENVLGLKSFDKGALLDKVLSRLRARGYYEVSVHVLDTRKHSRRLYIFHRVTVIPFLLSRLSPTDHLYKYLGGRQRPAIAFSGHVDLKEDDWRHS